MKYLINTFFNSMSLMIITLPCITLILSAILSLFIKKRIVILGFILIIYLALTFTIFNISFVGWIFIYLIIAYIGTFFGESVRFFSK